MDRKTWDSEGLNDLTKDASKDQTRDLNPDKPGSQMQALSLDSQNNMI